MKLKEIAMIPQVSDSFFQITKEMAANKKFMGESDHREIYALSTIYNEEDHYVFFNEDEKGVSSYLIIKEQVILGRDSAIIARSWTRPDVRNKGFLSALVRFLKEFMKMQVVSDDLQTASSKAFWESLRKKFSVRTLDLFNNKILDIDAYSEPSFRLIIESIGTKDRRFVPNTKKNVKEWVDPVLIPFIVFTDGDI
jgi:GNAT superfamily N-acetyltransferase